MLNASRIHTRDVLVLGRENPTTLSVRNETIGVGDSPKLFELARRGETLSDECITFGHVTTLSQMTIMGGTTDPACFLSE